MLPKWFPSYLNGGICSMFRKFSDGLPRNNQDTTVKFYHLPPPWSSAQLSTAKPPCKLRLYWSCTQKVTHKTPRLTQAPITQLLLNRCGAGMDMKPFQAESEPNPQGLQDPAVVIPSCTTQAEGLSHLQHLSRRMTNNRSRLAMLQRKKNLLKLLPRR